MSISPAASIWSATVNDQLNFLSKAGNYLSAINDSGQLILIDAITGKTDPKSPITLDESITSVSYFTYSNGYFIVVNNTTESAISTVWVFELHQILQIGKVINNKTVTKAIPVWTNKGNTSGSDGLYIPGSANPSYLVNEGVLYISYSQKGGGIEASYTYYMAAVSIESGEPAWTYNKKYTDPNLTNQYTTLTLPSGIVNKGNHLCANQEAIFLPFGNQLYAFNKAFGDQRFPRTSMVNPPSNVPQIDDAPLFSTEKYILANGLKDASNYSHVYAIDPHYGGTEWSYPATASTHHWKIACISEDETEVLVYNESGEVQLLEVKTGKSLWSAAIQLDQKTNYIIDSLDAIITVAHIQIIPQYRSKTKDADKKHDHYTEYTWKSAKNVYRIKRDIPTPTQIHKTPPAPTYEKLPFIGESNDAPSIVPVMINGAVLITTTTGVDPSITTTVDAVPLLEDENAAYFTGGANSIAFDSIGTDLQFTHGDFTMECWLRTTIGGQIFESQSTDKSSIRLNVSESGLIALAMTAQTTEDYMAYTLDYTPISDGEWHHLAIAVESGKGDFYIDGIHFTSNKVQLQNGTKYYNDDYKMTKSTYGAGKGPSHHLHQLTSREAKPTPVTISPQTSFSIGASSTSTTNAATGFTGLLREFRIWDNALSAEKINSRMFKVLGPFQYDSKTKLDKATKHQVPVPGNAIKGKEPKMLVNVHMDKSYSVQPHAFSASGTASNVLNDVNPETPQTGTFNYPCSTPTDLDLELKGFPYLLDHDHKVWPYEEHWAVRGEHAVTTDVALSSNGILCFGANNALYGVRKHDGKGLWIHQLSEFSNPIATEMGFLVLASEDTEKGKLCLINPQSGYLQVIGAATNGLGTFPTTFKSNRLLAAFGTYIAYAQAGGGIVILSDLETATPIAASSSSYTEVANIQIIGENVYWCETDAAGTINLRGRNMVSGTTVDLFTAIAVASSEYTVNAQHLYYADATDLVVVNATNGDAVTSVALNTVNSSLTATNLSGMTITPSGNQVILTQNGTTTGSITAVRPATLTSIWSKTALNKNVNAPVIGTDSRNVYCTAQDTTASGPKGSVIVRDVKNGDDRGSFSVTNPIESPAVVDHGTVYFACADNTDSSGSIDGAVHQIVFGDTNVLSLDGKSYYNIANPTTSGTDMSCWGYLNPLNACVEAWVNLNGNDDAGIISLSTGNAGQGVNLEMHVSDQTLYFKGIYFDSTGNKSISFNSTKQDAVPLNEWCHIAVNMSNDSKESKLPAAQLFINGKGQAITTPETVNSIPTCPTDFLAFLGATGTLTSPTSPANLCNGLIGTVRIWNSYQTVSQIMDRMHTQLIGTEESLMADWSFNRFDVEDVAGNATADNGFSITPKGPNADPHFILNELNFDKPNYPYLTYKGERYSQSLKGSNDLEEYKLIINAHNADGSPIGEKHIDIWYAEGSSTDPLYVLSGEENQDFATGTNNPWKEINKTADVSNQSIPAAGGTLTPPNGITVKTNTDGQAILRVATKNTNSGPGFDMYCDIIPKHERFHVNTLIDKQELKVVPPPTVKAQGELIQSYHHSTGGKINAHRQKGVYSTILKVEKHDKTPCVNQMVMVYTDTPQQISVGGQVYSVTSKNGAALYTNGLGEIIVEADATDTKGFTLEVSASFMHKGERTKYAVSESSHKRLAGVTTDDITTEYNTSWTGSGPNTSSSLLKSQYNSSSEKVAHSLRHLMSPANPKPSSNTDPNKHKKKPKGNDGADTMTILQTSSNESTDLITSVKPKPYTKPKPKPHMRQPIGTPMPDQVSSLRTLTYINRTKTMDLQALKKSILGIAPTTSSGKPTQGIRIGFVKGSGSDTSETSNSQPNQITLDYLDETTLPKAKAGQSIHHSDWLQDAGEDVKNFFDKVKGDFEKGEGSMAEWFGSDLFHDIESAAEAAANAFEHLVKDAEAMVLDFTSDIEGAITSVLNQLGPIGHLLADGIEKVMAVVDKVIKFVDILINTMLDFLMLLYEWEHIIATQGLLLDVIKPGYTHLNHLISGQAFISDLITDLGELSFSSTAPTTSKRLQTSVGDIKSKHTEGYGNQTHGVKSKSLLNKTHNNTHKMRTTKATAPSAPAKSDMGSKATAISTKSNSLFSGADLGGSLDPFTGIFNTIKSLVETDGIDTLLNDMKDPLKTVFPDELLEFIIGTPPGTAKADVQKGMLNQPIEIPFLSALYEFIDPPHQLTLTNLFGLVAAVPVVLVYEALSNGKFFDVEFGSSNMPSTFTLPSTSNNDVLTETSGSAPTPPSQSDIQAAGLLYTIFSELAVICDLVADYAVYEVLQNGGTKQVANVDPVKVMFKSISGVCGLVVAASNYGIASNLDKAIAIDDYYNPGNSHLAAYKKSLIRYAAPTFVVSSLFAAYDILQVEVYFQDQIEKLGEWAAETFGAFVIMYTPLVLIYMIDQDVKESGSIGESNTYESNLKTRVNLYIASSFIGNIYSATSLFKGKLAKQKTADLYMAFAGARQVLNEAAIILKAVGELKYGMQDQNYPTS